MMSNTRKTIRIEETDRERPFLSRPVLVLLTLLSATCLFFAIGSYKTLSSHETFTAVAARHMIASGDYFVPYQAGLPRFEKPPVGYWLVIASAWVTGDVSEMSARLPAAISAVLLCGLMGYWAARWYTKEAGIYAALAQATFLYVLVYARKSEADLFLTLIDTFCLFLIVEQPAGQSWKQGFWRWLGIFSLLGLSFMTKFHFGPVLILGTTGAYWLIQKRYRDAIHLLNPIGWMLCLGPIAWWMWYIGQQMPEAWEVWRFELIGRATGEFSAEPIWYFLPRLIWMTLPWTLLWVLELETSWRMAFQVREPHERFLWMWFLIPFAIINLQLDKHTQYLMFLLPMYSLIVGRRLARALVPQHWLSFRWSRGKVIFLTLLSIAGGIGLGNVVRQELPAQPVFAVVVGLCLAVGCGASAWLFRIDQQRAGLLSLAISFTGIVMVIFGWVVPIQDHWRAQMMFSRRVSQHMRDEPLVGYDLKYAPLFYLGETLRNYREPAELRNRLQRDGSILVVGYEDRAAELEQFGTLTSVESVTPEERRIAEDDPILKCWRLELRDSPQVSREIAEQETL